MSIKTGRALKRSESLFRLVYSFLLCYFAINWLILNSKLSVKLFESAANEVTKDDFSCVAKL